ncbi:hypothetical protein [Devriesea agamarum]|uniref:hypothetical protein n=1 Tax=Devriesea agamarum TaxID=472569 RepID=UPI00071DD427|nr:hypothetical protein [Devriesea agamarum]
MSDLPGPMTGARQYVVGLNGPEAGPAAFVGRCNLSLDEVTDCVSADQPQAKGPEVWAAVIPTSDGLVLARHGQAASPLFFHVHHPSASDAPEAVAVTVAAQLPELVWALRSAGYELGPDPQQAYAYVRGDADGQSSHTLIAGIQRVRADEIVRIHADGDVRRCCFERVNNGRPRGTSRGRRAADAGDSTGVVEAVGLALESAFSPDRVAGHDEVTGPAVGIAMTDDAATAAVALALGAWSATDLPEDAPALATVAVRSAATRSAHSVQALGPRAQIVVDRLGSATAHRDLHPSTDQFKRDLGLFLRTRSAPPRTLAEYAHFCAMRQLAETVPLVVDTTGLPGAGLLASTPKPQVAEVFDDTQVTVSGLDVVTRARHTVDKARQTVTGLAKKVAQARRKRLCIDDLVRLPDPVDVASSSCVSVAPSAANTGVRADDIEAVCHTAAACGVDLVLPCADARVLSAVGPAGLASCERVLPPEIQETPAAPTRTIDDDEWFTRLKGSVHAVLRSSTLGARPWINQRAALDAFDAYIAGRLATDSAPLWRIYLLELWLRELLESSIEDDNWLRAEGLAAASEGDDHGAHDEPAPKEVLASNEGKNLDLAMPASVGGGMVRRYPLRTGKFTAETEMASSIGGYVRDFFEALDAHLATADEDDSHWDATVGRPWNLTVSEKIIAIMQGRSYFVWDIHPGIWARNLSKYVARTPAGIGLGDPVTMHLAIQEAGLPRVLLASAAGAVGKLIGRKGLFYEVVGGNVRAIDGPTEYSVYPANVSAKLPPKDPDIVADFLNRVVLDAVPPAWRDTFTGTVVMDANDIGRNTLGKAAPESSEYYELQFADNPLGQGREQTPMAVVFAR